jgi:outer membrane protein TolC
VPGKVVNIQPRRRTEEAKSRLAAAIGVPAAALDGVTVSFDGFRRTHGDVDPGRLRREALLHRPDLHAALLLYAASEAALQTQIANQYPDLRLGPAYTFDMGTNKFALGVSGLTLPVFNRNEGPIAEAEAHRAEAAAKFEELQAAVIGEVDRAVRADGAARRQLLLADSLYAARRLQLDKLRRTFSAGETDRLAVERAARSLHVAEIAHADSVVAAQQATGRLEDALERPLSSEPLDVGAELEPRGAQP